VVRGDTRQYLDRHPGPQDLALVVEVADTSLQRDRTFKKRVYALAGIPVYWIVNLSESQFEVYTDPSGPAESPDYHERQDYGTSDAVPLVIEGHEVDRLVVQELLP
ncbi:MAG: Uma2 family endonuclease, partial [Anaerolineae bacterium]